VFMFIDAMQPILLLAISSATSALSVGGVVVPNDASMSAPARVRVSHILVDSEELAEQCVSLLAKGESFAALAESVSMCESKAKGGELGWITPGLMVPEFDAAAFTYPPGEVAKVNSDFGWHLVRVEEASYVPGDMEPAELYDRLKRGDADGESPSIQLVDIRDDAERAQAMIKAPFRHLPYNEWQTWAEAAIAGTLEPPISKDIECLFMDHRGGRGERIAAFLAQQGYVRARFLRGGINSYAEEADPSVPLYLESDGDCLTCNEH
jgi:rhodanese-related sulfurtransferase